MSKRASDSAKSCRGVLGISLGWMLVVGISLVTRCLGELTDYPVARFTVTDDGRLQPEAPDPKEPLEVVLGARVRGARWVHPADLPEGALDGPPPLQPSWQVQTWRVEQGLPENEIKALCQTSDGYLWVGTPSGLARFDGNRFVIFNQRNTPVLREVRDDIRVLRTDREGRLWVGAQQGIARFDRGKWEKVCSFDRGLDERLRDFSIGTDGTVWVGCRRGLMRLSEGKLSMDRVPEPFQGGDVVAVLASQDGSIWASAGGRFLHWDRSKATLSEIWVGNEGSSIVGSLQETADGVVWAASPGALRWFKDGRLEMMTLPEGDFSGAGLSPGRLAMNRSGGGCAILGLNETVCIFSQGAVEPVRAHDGGSVQQAQCLVLDSDDNIWIGTRGRGLLRLRKSRIHRLLIQEPAWANKVFSVARGPRESIWTGIQSGLMVWGGQGAVLFQYPLDHSTVRNTYVLSMIPDESVRTCFPGMRLLRLGPASRTGGELTYPVKIEWVGWAGDARSHILQDDGTEWLGSPSGLWRIEPGRDPVRMGPENGLSATDVRSLYMDREGSLWIGTKGSGLWRLQHAKRFTAGSRFEAWSREHGLPGDSSLAIHETNDGVMWVGVDQDLARVDEQGVVVFTANRPPLDGEIHQILEDDRGDFWLSGQRGVCRVRRAELDAVAAGRLKQVQWLLFGETEGMPNAATAGGSQPVGCKGSQGELYFATGGGVAVLHPDESDLVLPKPVVMVETVVADGRVVRSHGEPSSDETETIGLEQIDELVAVPRAQQPSRLGPGRARDLRIRYTATSLTAPERLRFEYRLEGLETEWRPGGAERMAYYTNLKPGNYRFQVRAANHQGTWSEAPAEWAFRLEPAFHQTALFPVTIALVGVAVAGGFTLWRLSWQRKVMLLEQRVALDRERKRIARDMHDDLGAQLSTLALQLSGTSETTARTSADAQHKVRDVIRHLNSLIWAVEPGHESVEALTDFLGNFAQEYLGRAGLRTSLECPESSGMQASLRTEARRHVVAVVKEALRNVVRHAHATEVRLRFAVQESTLVVEIEDDGQGFDASQVPQDRGLGHMRERLSEVGGRCDVASVPGKGTRIRIAVGLGDVAEPKNPVSLGF